jgi:hypothetical protein
LGERRLTNGTKALINGSVKGIKFPLTLALSPIGGEGINKRPHNALNIIHLKI